MISSDAIQDVSQTQESPTPPSSPPRPARKENLLLILFRLIYVTSKKLLLRSKSFVLFYTILRWLLTTSMILTVSMFAYTAFYQSFMPTEVTTDLFCINMMVTDVLFRFMKKTLTSSLWSVLTRQDPAAIPMWPSSSTLQNTNWCWANTTQSELSWSCRTPPTTR